MLRSSSSQSSNRVGSELNNSSDHRRSMPSLFKNNYRSAKKQLSLILNKAEFEICHAPDENEMFEFMRSSNTEGNNNNTNLSESTISDDTITDRQQSDMIYSVSSTTPHKNRLISHIKHRLAPCRFDSSKKDETDAEKNQGFLLVDQVDADLVLVPNDMNDPQHTRHAEPCEHGDIDEDTVDINQIHLIATTPVTPSLLPPQQSSSVSSIRPIINHSNSDSDVQATQAGVECAIPDHDNEHSNVHDTQLSSTDSSTSTNSSNNDPQFSIDDRSTLDDIGYIQFQKRDLERITVYEIALNDKRRDYLQDLPQNENDELDFDHDYKEVLQQNLKLKEELKRLEEEKARIHSQWACEVCTYINEPYIKTRKDVCEMCEGPSPLKKHTLTS